MAVRYIDFNKIWQRHIDLYAEVFIYSLKCLSEDNCLNGQEDEDRISVYLWKNLKKVCARWSLTKNQEIPAPQVQTPVQDIIRAAKKRMKALKKPDFTCFRFNASKGENIGLHIECKKLGKPSSSGWKFNKNYITDGIMRFDLKEYQYGMDAISGMMVGYIVSMLPEDILKEVNEYQNKYLKGHSKLKFNFSSGLVFKTQQKITRKNIRPKNFHLSHLWVDLKQNNN